MRYLYCTAALLALALVSTAGPCSGQSLAPAPAPSADEQPLNFTYTQLWSDEMGETHVQECKMSGFSKQNYSSLVQFVKDDFGGNATKFVFTELSVNLSQPLHSLLLCNSYIKTTDGTYRAFQPGEVLFQDNTKNSPAENVPEHYSGAVGDEPCQQFVLQFDREPEVNHICPF